MNSDSDYLWDRSGEPDPEIQQLEEILGTLRYEPRPFEIPSDSEVNRSGSFFRDFGPLLAIAATVAIALLGLGVWLRLQRLQRAQPAEVARTPRAPEVNGNPDPKPVVPPKEDNAVVVSAPGSDHKSTEGSRRRVNRLVVAGNSNRLRNQALENQQLARNEREGRAAKDQLMLALRLASEKLNFAQKKAQSVNSRELIHNQHKIG
jgi:hypothetical protein